MVKIVTMVKRIAKAIKEGEVKKFTYHQSDRNIFWTIREHDDKTGIILEKDPEPIVDSVVVVKEGAYRYQWRLMDYVDYNFVAKDEIHYVLKEVLKKIYASLGIRERPWKRRRIPGSHKDCRFIYGIDICEDCTVEVCPELECLLGRKDAHNFRDNYKTCKDCEHYDSCLESEKQNHEFDDEDEDPNISDTLWDSSKHNPQQ